MFDLEYKLTHIQKDWSHLNSFAHAEDALRVARHRSRNVFSVRVRAPCGEIIFPAGRERRPGHSPSACPLT